MAAALGLSIAAYLQSALSHAIYNWKAHSGDQNSYLRLALRIHEGEGFANGNYHPLVAMLFSPVASREWEFYSQAKLIDIAAGAVVLGVVFALGRRLFGAPAALAAAAALAFSPAFAARAARSEPEILLTGLFFAAWACWTVGLDRRRWAVAAGALAGLAYLAKGTGQFLLLGFVALPWLRHGPAGWWARRRDIGAMVAAYAIAASPLLVTNWQAFGSPFYAFPSAHAMWYDEWDDRLGSADGRHITFRTFVATHGPADVVGRLADGVREVPPEWAEAFEVALPAGSWWVIVGAGMLALGTGLWRRGGGSARALGSGAPLGSSPVRGAGEGSTVLGRGARSSGAPPHGDAATPERTIDLDPDALRQRLRDAAWTAGVLAFPIFGFFVWYAPIANSARFALPLVPIAFTVLAGGLAVAARRWRPGGAGSVPARLLVSAATLVISALALRAGEWRSPADVARSDRDLNARAIELLAFLGRTAAPGGETALWGRAISPRGRCTGR